MGRDGRRVPWVRRRRTRSRVAKIITTIGETPFAVTVYKLGDKYVAARSNEFGYANYELEKVQE